MQINTIPESPDDFTTRVAGLLQAESTHVYFDTSFLMWLTTLGPASRAQFKNWAGTLGERAHVPLWSMHEYYRHHTAETLKSRMARRATELAQAAKAFQLEMSGYSDLSLLKGQSENAFQDAVRRTLEQVALITDAAREWNYQEAADDIIIWMNSRALTETSVFQSMPLLKATGSARFTQDLPPGFLDRRKKDKADKGSNRYGDLLFWMEVMEHSKSCQADDVVVVTRDRKGDWYADLGQPELATDWKRLRGKWHPVPRPHPTLAFELRVTAEAELVLIDELYLGALLWKFGRPQYERLAAVAIEIAPAKFIDAEQGPRPITQRAGKRREATNIGTGTARALVSATFRPAEGRAEQLLSRLSGDAPQADAFIEELGGDTLKPLDLEGVAVFCRGLHDAAKVNPGPHRQAATKLLDMLDDLPADTAAAVYVGFLSSAYFDGEVPLARPNSHFFSDLIDWEADPAFQKVLVAFSRYLAQVRSAALYYPTGKHAEMVLRFEHDAEQLQDPATLKQVYLGDRAVLSDGQLKSDLTLGGVLGHSKASVKEIAQLIYSHFGLPPTKVRIEGADPGDYRTIPEFLGFREFDRFTQDSAHLLGVGPEPTPEPDADIEADIEADTADLEDDGLDEEDQD